MQSKNLLYTVLATIFWFFSWTVCFVGMLMFSSLFFLIPDISKYNGSDQSFVYFVNEFYIRGQYSPALVYLGVLVVNLLIVIISLVKGRVWLPAYKILSYLGLLNFIMYPSLIIGSIFFKENNFILVVSGCSLGFLAICYLQISLFFIKEKSKENNIVI